MTDCFAQKWERKPTLRTYSWGVRVSPAPTYSHDGEFRFWQTFDADDEQAASGNKATSLVRPLMSPNGSGPINDRASFITGKAQGEQNVAFRPQTDKVKTSMAALKAETGKLGVPKVEGSDPLLGQDQSLQRAGGSCSMERPPGRALGAVSA